MNTGNLWAACSITATARAGLLAACLALGGCGAGGSGAEADASAVGKQPMLSEAGATTAAHLATGSGALAPAPAGSGAVKPATAPVATATPPGPAPDDSFVASRSSPGTAPAGNTLVAASPGSRSPSPGGTLRAPAAAGGDAECLVDFKDGDAVVSASIGLYFDRIYLPWFQQCGSAGWVDLRPLLYGHVHLAFASTQVLPCLTDAFPSRIDEDGTCHPVDLKTEPRTHIVSHWPTEIIQVRALAYNSQLPDYTRLVFDLNRVRVVATGGAVRVCYHKAGQQPDGPWEAAGPGGQPGTWLCWNRLAPGHWDLSDWATGIDDVRITGADGELAPVSLDDVSISIH